MRGSIVEESEALVGRKLNWMWRSLGLARRNQPGRYSVLLVSILLLLVAQPIFASHQIAQSLVTITMSLMLLSALYTLNDSRTYFVIGLSLMVPAFGFRWFLQFQRNATLEIVTSITSSAFIMVTVVGLVRQLFRVRRVTFDTISAAICAYLLMAIAWGFMYAIVELEHPGSFSADLLASQPGAATSSMIVALHNFIYYSFVCLTTTGYGDIAPKSEIARMLSILESVVGQMYLAILIARLVSLEVAQSLTSERER